MAFKTGQIVRFTANSRFDEWKKRDLAEISAVLAQKPDNQSTIYMVEDRAKKGPFWVVEGEIEPYFDQLSLF